MPAKTTSQYIDELNYSRIKFKQANESLQAQIEKVEKEAFELVERIKKECDDKIERIKKELEDKACRSLPVAELFVRAAYWTFSQAACERIWNIAKNKAPIGMQFYQEKRSLLDRLKIMY